MKTDINTVLLDSDLTLIDETLIILLELLIPSTDLIESQNINLSNNSHQVIQSINNSHSDVINLMKCQMFSYYSHN